MTRFRAVPARLGLAILPAAALVYFFFFGVGRPALLWANVGQPFVGMAWLVAYLWASGVLALRLLRLRDAGERPDALIVLLLGAGAAVLAVFLLGILGILRPAVFFAWSLAVVVAGFVSDPPWRGAWRNGLEEPWSAREIALAGSSVLLLLAVAVVALAPDVSWDSLAYHRAMGKIAIARGNLGVIPWMWHTNLPSNIDYFFVNAMLVGGDRLAVPANLILYALAAAATFRAGLLLLPRPFALLAALVFLLLPVNAEFAATSYVEIGWAAFATGALWCALEWTRRREGRWLTLAAIFSGLSAGSKTFGIFTGLAVGGIILFSSLDRRRLRSSAAPALKFAAIFLVTGSPCYIKSFFQTGTPFWPMSLGVFHVRYWNEEIGRRMYTFVHDLFQARSPLEPGSLVAGAWRSAADPTVALALAFFAGALLRPRLLPRLWPLLLFAFVHVFAWSLEVTQTRFLIPGLPAVLLGLMLLTLPVGAGTPGRAGFAVFWACVLLVFLPSWAPAAQRIVEALPVARGLKPRESLLRGYPLYEAETLTNRLVPLSGRVLLFEEIRGAFLDRDYMWGDPLNQAVLYYPALRDARELRRRMEELGISHVLVGVGTGASENWYSADTLLKMDGVLRSSRLVFSAFGFSLYELSATGAAEGSRPAASASSTYSDAFPASGAIDGSLANWGNGGGWNSAGTPAPGHPEFLTLAYPAPRRLRRAALVSHLDPGNALKSFVLQYESGGAWKDIPETRVEKAEDDTSWELRFPEVTAAKFRLLVTGAGGGQARVMEILLD